MAKFDEYSSSYRFIKMERRGGMLGRSAAMLYQ